MRKKQKIKSKKQSQRSFRAFISIVNWYKNKFDVALYISNIYGNEYQKKEVNIHKLPMWRDNKNIVSLYGIEIAVLRVEPARKKPVIYINNVNVGEETFATGDKFFIIQTP